LGGQSGLCHRRGLEQTCGDDGTDPDEDQAAALLSHAQAALADDSVGLARLANYLGERGSYAAARELSSDSLKHGSGSSAPSTRTPRTPALTSPTAPGRGAGAGARDQYAALLPISERVLGAEHPDTLATRRNLANWAERA